MNKVVLTDNEWKIMSVLWKRGSGTLRNIMDAVCEDTGWSKHAVISFLKRMLSKKFIRMEETKPARIYYPLIKKEDVVIQETRSMLRKLYNGNIGLMVSNIVNQNDFSKNEIDELMDILKEAKEGK